MQWNNSAYYTRSINTKPMVALKLRPCVLSAVINE